MSQRTCDYCRAPIHGSGVLGRPWPNRSAATYCCFGCLSLGEQSQLQAQTDPPRAQSVRVDGTTVRLGIGILVSGQSMIFGLGVNLNPPEPIVLSVVHAIIFMATMVVLGLLGGPLVRTAVTELRRGQITIEALFLLTLAGALIGSMQSWLTGKGPIYFEVVSVLLVVYTLGRMIGARSRAAAIASTEVWTSALRTCRVLDDQQRTRLVDISEIIPGDRIEVRPGEAIPVDGTVSMGVGFVSEAAVSGEPFAVVRRPGDRVLAGMHSHDASFQITASSRGQTRQIDRLIEAVTAAREQPISLQSQADRLGQVFLPLIVAVAVSTFAVWTYLRGWETGLFNAMSVLLVACPCALGLATPIIVWSTLTRLAERGMIVRAGDTIERLAKVNRILFDKTGTLTSDQFLMRDLVTIATGPERAALLGWLSLVQEQSNHPIAKPFASLPKPDAAESPRVTQLTVVPGCGVEGRIEFPDGRSHRIQIGRPEWITQGGTHHAETLLAQLRAVSGHRVDCAVDGELVAVAMLDEQLRTSSQETLAALHRMGIPVEVLTGDTTARAEALQLPAVKGNLLPEEKRQIVAERRAAGEAVLMIGDGINDSSALAAAEVGLALASGTDLANSAAAATLYHDDLRVIPWTIALAREAVATVRRNLLRAAMYNLIGITLAATGCLHPIAAALLMLVSSLWIVYSSTQVGVRPLDCGCEPEPASPATDDRPTDPATESNRPTTADSVTNVGERPTVGNPRWIACGHGLAIAAQGLLAAAMLDASMPLAMGLMLAFAVVGGVLARVWLRWPNIPHAVDMSIGMLSLGNLGMVVGWWADLGWRPMEQGSCSCCVDLMREGLFHAPWMWLGMLICGNLAMIFMMRRPHTDVCDHLPAMYSGGNLGMLLGMWGGGWLAQQVVLESVPVAAGLSFLGMSIGMIVGMLVLTEVTRQLIGGIRALPGMVRWMRLR
ncbi:heavy metal translocating P-type ATPase [Tuwongella immobilis]|uniref:P-type ATPase A domain-containing protein n=1 Tax=Tuwongella immobilis TaxID=692036 RepID=A0A6C2YNM3_9BACT|nr:heavy metal translocating P-type ATPase [Tuwongella immobilis]VIP02799.1 heavy metal translocating p-type atpase : Heavy metal translocating P-type ATPase OS=Isosphaera pallida (strain ATCC 43644 / DSM 9630 / IS1B) GN=Isop_0399 PE=3 SV=1: E1-E2_ATPase: Hydrolase [Tuwongella immobilis]VTS02485.1 heavy metal translocating p-type atpase : Heavy metal translocating P-type ATPase OS=Isosphaera pallida (strain ATCC 43644 / DSM 9630 / IS1B) GN=Isop_0399 PE=3 SV=1: E1-E2_ATPase: Hydrolase [Tuwongella 